MTTRAWGLRNQFTLWTKKRPRLAPGPKCSGGVMLWGNLGDEAVGRPALGAMVGAGRGRKIGRGSVAGEIGVAVAIKAESTADVSATSAEIGGVMKAGAVGKQLQGECVSATMQSALQRALNRKVSRLRVAGDVRLSCRIHCDGVTHIRIASTCQGRKRKRRAGGVEFGDEHVCVAVVAALERSRGSWKIRRRSAAGHIGVPGSIHRDPVSVVGVISAEVGGIDQCRTTRIELGHEGRAD